MSQGTDELLVQRRRHPSVLYWIMAYLFVRYGFLAGQISSSDFWTGMALGVLTVGAFLTFVPTVVTPRLIRPRVQRATE
jgi:uncharacterized protein involved in response to NO